MEDYSQSQSCFLGGNPSMFMSPLNKTCPPQRLISLESVSTKLLVMPVNSITSKVV